MTTGADPAAGAPAGGTPSSGIVEQVQALLAGPRPLPIVQAGHPVLRRPAARYEGELGDALLAELLDAMRATMHAAPGVGLAAPQVGLGVAIAVLEDAWPVDPDSARVRERTPLPYGVLVNPRYEPVGTERVSFYEGCLSVEGWVAVRARWRTVRLIATDEHGTPVDEVVTGWPARIVQHETDHLAGELYVDRAELRSLASAQEAWRYAADLTPDAAARELGFDLA